ncbi:MAG: hypothetical protein JNM45_08410 [Rhizobiales bacterium]|nr:hypothetical protein [Hyphomicrobiales bacterium]
MKHLILVCLALFLIAPANAASCDLTQAEALLRQPRPEKPDRQFDVLEQQSVEGGAWTIYNGPNGKPGRIIRTDYGEMGRSEQILAATDRDGFIIRETQFHYSVPLFATGSAVVREETVYYRFCEGELLLPSDTEGEDGYMKAGREAANEFFAAQEIADAIKATGLKPPLSK